MGEPRAESGPSSGEPSELRSGTKSPTTDVARARNGKFESTPLQRRVVQTSGSPAAERASWRRARPPRVAIAVGTPITGRPPHRTVCAAFLHTAPTSDD